MDIHYSHLKTIRHYLGLSKAQLAKAVECHTDAYTSYEYQKCQNDQVMTRIVKLYNDNLPLLKWWTDSRLVELKDLIDKHNLYRHTSRIFDDQLVKHTIPDILNGLRRPPYFTIPRLKQFILYVNKLKPLDIEKQSQAIDNDQDCCKIYGISKFQLDRWRKGIVKPVTDPRVAMYLRIKPLFEPIKAKTEGE